MKVDPRNKWRKVVSLSLDRLDKCFYRSLMQKLDTSSTQAWFIDIYNFKISRSEIRPMMTWMIRISFLTTLVIYKVYFKSHQVRKQRPRTHILCVKLLRLYALGFCNQVLSDLHCLWSEELCSQQQSFKLLELVTYWDPCKGVSYRLEICASKERMLLQDQVQLGIGVKVQL